MRYGTEDGFARNLMWQALQFIRFDRLSNSVVRPESFWTGYFEFVLTPTDRLLFADFKVNEAYLS